MDTNIKTKARTMLIISVIVFGTLGIFTRNINVTSGELALYRAVLATILISVYMFFTGKFSKIKNIKKDGILLFFSGMSMGTNWILLFEAYRYTSISSATISYYFAPVIVTIICPFLFKEKMTKKKIICFIVSTIGLVLTIGINNITSGGNDFIGIMFGLMAACFYACVIIFNKLIKNVGGIERTFLQFCSAVIVLTPYVILTSGFNLDKLNSTGWIYLLIVGLFHTGITYCLYFSSLKDLPGQESSIISYIDPLVAVLISVLIAKESMTIWQIIGAILILGFTMLNEIPKKSKKTVIT